MGLLVVLGFSLAAVLAVLLGYGWRLLQRERQQRAALQAKFQSIDHQINTLQLQNLESKLNPHLFKNILNSIQSHAYQTYYALDKLANVLDYILYESRKRLVSPKEEIEFALNLIEINKIKLSPLFNLTVKKRIAESDPFYQQALLAPLISIDLIENAFKHADLRSSDSFISIVLEFRGGTFLLTVSNKISEKPTIFYKEKSGVGLSNLQQRLELLYPQRHKLEKFVEGDTYLARLTIELG